LFIKKEWLKFYDQRPAISEVVISWDTTFKDTESSDYCVGVVLGRSTSDQRIYLLEVIRRKMDFVKTRECMRLLAARYPGSVNLIEESANGHALLQTLQSEIPNLIGIKATDSKESRMQAISPIIESGQLILPNPEFDSEIQECVDELLAFNKGQHDDFCDALSQGLLRLRNQAIPPWLDQLNSMSEEECLELQMRKKRPTTIEQLFWPDQFMDKE
jgi:predicted phage terminase large subunit-like protein